MRRRSLGIAGIGPSLIDGKRLRIRCDEFAGGFIGLGMMSVSVFAKHMLAASGAASLMLLYGLGGSAQSQVPAPTTALPEIEGVKPRITQAPPPPKTHVTSGKPRAPPAPPPPPPPPPAPPPPRLPPNRT